MEPVKAPATRGRPPRIDRAGIVAAAEGIVLREGIDALTVRRVADELGTSAMALYRHVADKNALLVLVLNELYRRLPQPRLPKDPRRRVLALWRFLRDGLSRYPWVVQALVHSDTIAL
jgi:AcrR family transcriptional regulator